MKRPLILLVLALATLFYPLANLTSFWWGLPTLQFVPWRVYAAEQLGDGILPLWNALNGAGAPLFANYQSGLLYPFNWLSLIAPADPTTTGYVGLMASIMSIVAVLHLFIAGWGMYRLTGRLGLSDFGRGMSAISFALGGYLVARLGTYPMIMAATWLPWLLVITYDVMTTGMTRKIGSLACFTALLLLAGHAQTAWYSLLMVGVFAVWLGIRNLTAKSRTQRHEDTNTRRELKELSRLGGVIVGILLGAGVASLQLSATAELLGQSQRSDGAEYSFAVNFSYAPVRSINFISPQFFGTPVDGTYFTVGAYFEDAVYIGLIPLISAIAAVIAFVRRRKRDAFIAASNHVPFAVIIVVIGFVLALGQYSPIFPFLYDNVPTFDLFQAPVRWHLWTVFGLSILAGIGVSAWGRDTLTRRIARYGLVAGLGAAVLMFILLIGRDARADTAILARGILAPAIIGAVAAWLTLRQPERETGAHWRWSGVVLVTVCVELAWSNWGLNPMTNDLYRPSRPETADGRTYWRADDDQATRYNDLLLFNDYYFVTRDESLTLEERLARLRHSQLANINLLDDVASLNNFDPLLVGHYANYMRLTNQVEDNRALLAAANVGTVYTLDGMQTTDRFISRAYVVGDDAVCWHETQASLDAAISAPTWDAHTQLHLLGDGECAPPREVSGGSASIRRDDISTRVMVRVNADRLSWLVLSDTDYPGWRAYVDGIEAPIYRANGMFRAMQIDDGVHTVEFAYTPGWLLSALALSTLSGILTIALLRVRD